MATATVSADLITKYGDHGDIKLSSGFIQRYFESDCTLDEPAIMQIINFRLLNHEEISAQCRLSDGCFRMTQCYFHLTLAEQVARDNFAVDPRKDENGKALTPRTEFPVIAITKMERRKTAAGNTGEEKDQLFIMEYEHIVTLDKALGSAQTHMGGKSVNEFMNFKSTEEYSVISGGCVKREKSEDPFDDQEVVTTHAAPAPAAPAPRSMAAHVPAPPPPVRAPAPSRLGSNVTPIKMITPYVNKWRIAGICTAKQELRDIKTRNGEMKVFNFDLTDKDGDSIRLAAFGEAAQKAYSIIQTDAAYYVAGGTVKQANKRFNTTGHDYELTLRSDSEITPCHDQIPKPLFQLNVCKLDRIVSHKDEAVDVLAIIDKFEPLVEFTSKAGKDMMKRELSLIDETSTVVTLVLWGEQAKNMDSHCVGQSIGIKGAIVKEWNGGFTLGCVGGTKLELTPPLPECPALFDWYALERPTAETKTVSATSGGGSGEAMARDLRFLGTATALQLGNEPELATGRYMNIKGMVTSMKHDQSLYQACANEGCQKKVVELDGQFRCEKCNTNSDSFKWNYMVSMEISDLTGSVWVTMFSKAAEKLFGKTAQELGRLKEENEEAFARVLDGVRFQNKMWRVRGRAETYNEETRIRYQAFDVNEVDYDKYITEMEKTLQLLEAL